MNLLLEVGKTLDIDVETQEVIMRTFYRDPDGEIQAITEPFKPSLDDLIPRPPVIP